MSTSILKRRNKAMTAAQKRAAKQAEAAAKQLHFLAESLKSLSAANEPVPTPRNWWHLQAGRFKDDSTFPDFVAKVQAARKREG